MPVGPETVYKRIAFADDDLRMVGFREGTLQMAMMRSIPLLSKSKGERRGCPRGR